MSRFLTLNGRSNNHGQFLIGLALSHGIAQADFMRAKQTDFQVAICCDSQSVASGTKVFTHRSYKTHSACNFYVNHLLLLTVAASYDIPTPPSNWNVLAVSLRWPCSRCNRPGNRASINFNISANVTIFSAVHLLPSNGISLSDQLASTIRCISGRQ